MLPENDACVMMLPLVTVIADGQPGQSVREATIRLRRG